MPGAALRWRGKTEDEAMGSEDITTCLVRIYIVDPRFCFRYTTCSVARSRGGVVFIFKRRLVLATETDNF